MEDMCMTLHLNDTCISGHGPLTGNKNVSHVLV